MTQPYNERNTRWFFAVFGGISVIFLGFIMYNLADQTALEGSFSDAHGDSVSIEGKGITVDFPSRGEHYSGDWVTSGNTIHRSTRSGSGEPLRESKSMEYSLSADKQMLRVSTGVGQLPITLFKSPSPQTNIPIGHGGL